MNIEKINKKLRYEKYVNPNFDWDNIAIYLFDKNFSNPNFIDTFIDKINWRIFSIYGEQLSNNLDLCERYNNNIYWYELSNTQDFSFKFCKKFYMKIVWSTHCVNHQVNSKILFTFAYLFDDQTWFAISEFQKNLTKSFLDQYHHKISLSRLYSNFNISDSLKEYFQKNYINSCCG